MAPVTSHHFMTHIQDLQLQVKPPNSSMISSHIYEVLASCFVATSTPVRGARKRGRPRGSVGTSTRRPRARGSVRKAIHAAEAAAAQVGLSKGYAAYGYSLQGAYTPNRNSFNFRIQLCDCPM